MGRGEKVKPCSLLFLPITPLSHSTLIPITPSRASRFSPALAFLACSRSVLYTKPWERLWRRQMHDKVITLLSPVTFSLRLSCKGGLEDCRQFFVSF